jgi:GDP-L-fucose synthase
VILLTGGRGFIGQALARALGPDLLTPDRRALDLLDGPAVAAYLRQHPCEAIIHGAVQPGHRNASDPTRQLERNCRMFFNLAQAMDPQARLLFLGSGAVYDTRMAMDGIAEAELGRSIPADEHGFSKYICARFMEGRDAFTELRLFGVFGPGEDPMIRFISNAICKALLGLPITCRQDRSFSYLWVEDLAPVLRGFLSMPREYGAYNLVPDAPVALVAVAERVRALTGASVPIQVAQPGQGLAYAGSNARLRQRLPELALTALDPAILRLVAHYRSQPLDPERFKVDP